LCAGLGEAVGVGAGFNDGAVEGEPVDDRGAEPRVSEGLGPAIWGWLMFVRAGFVLVPYQNRSRFIY
jgi:hypothetical protein